MKTVAVLLSIILMICGTIETLLHGASLFAIQMFVIAGIGFQMSYCWKKEKDGP